MTTPHDTALEAAAIALFSEESGDKCTWESQPAYAREMYADQAQAAITAYLAALRVDEEALASSIYAVLAKDWYNRKLGVLPVTGQQCLMAVQTLRPYLRTPQPSLTELLDESWLRKALEDMPPADYSGQDDYFENIVGLCKSAVRRKLVGAV